MVLVFIILGIFIFLFLILFIILFSSLRIQIKDLYTTNIPTKTKLKYNITISLYLFNRIKWIWITINEQKAKKIISKVPKIDIKKLEQDIEWQDFKVAQKLQPKISYLNLNADLGVENPVITAFTVSIINSLIGILLPHFAKTLESKKYKYKIVPIYQNKILYKFKLNCIIEVKMVHIINVIYIFIKKGKSDKNERTTSYRKSYGYSYE